MRVDDWFLTAAERGNPATRLDSRHPDGTAWTTGNEVRPLIHGKPYFAELKEDPRLRVIPVVILTTSQAEEDILRSYALHANAYVSKPVDFEQFMDVIRQIDNFFITVVELPR